VLSSAFAFESADEAAAAFRGEAEHYIYGRWGNPTVADLEARVAALENAEDAVATASGMAAVSGALLSHLKRGDHVIAPLSFYGESSRVIREQLPELGIEASFVDATRVDAYAAALRPNTRVLYAESPANPTLSITDLAGLAELARSHGAVSIVDNTFATPFAQRPLDLGADLSVHSMTKALGGHGDAIGGVVCGSKQRAGRVRERVVKGLGAVLSPFNAFLISRGIRTFSLRQARATESALALARYLETHPAVECVHYPGLESHPGHEVARRQMSAFGALVAFELRGGLDAGKRLLDGVRLFTHAVSLGDARSLVTHPASTTASTMPAELRARAGIRDGLIRLSIGIEDEPDLRADLAAALAAAS